MSELKLLKISFVGIKRWVNISNSIVAENQDKLVILCELQRNNCIKYATIETYIRNRISRDSFAGDELQVSSPLNLRRFRRTALRLSQLRALFNIEGGDEMNDCFVGNNDYESFNRLWEKLSTPQCDGDVFKPLSVEEHYKRNLSDKEKEILLQEVIEYISSNELSYDLLEGEIKKARTADVLKQFEEDEWEIKNKNMAKGKFTDSEFVFVPFILIL